MLEFHLSNFFNKCLHTNYEDETLIMIREQNKKYL